MRTAERTNDSGRAPAGTAAVLGALEATTWTGAAVSWMLWHAYLAALKRWTVAVAPRLPRFPKQPILVNESRHTDMDGTDDAPTEHLLVCWRNMYHAAAMQEAMRELQPRIGRLLEASIDDFQASLAVARLAGEPSDEESDEDAKASEPA